MAIKPPSDIVLDVALAADPVKREAATRRLASAADSSSSFRTGLAPSFPQVPSIAQSAPTLSRTAQAGLDPYAKAVGGLETFFLRTAFEQMLPDTKLKGSIASGGGIWKSMLADALATHVSASGALDLGLKMPAASRSAG